MKKIVYALPLILLFTSCKNDAEKDSIATIPDLALIGNNWTQELLDKGDVGPECTGNFEQWKIDNPDSYYGVQEINILKSDANGDSVEDALLYFPADNCVGGVSSGSDYALFVYSQNNTFIQDKEITSLITQKINKQLQSAGTTNIYRSIVRFTGFDTKVAGSYFVYSENDASCCPTDRGTFSYDPISKKINMLADNDMNMK